MTTDIKIIEEDVADEQFRSELIDYLKPHETKALFLLGNILNHYDASALYVARKNGKIVAVCGYYAPFQSCSIFSEDHSATQALAHIMLKNHPSVRTTLGMADIVKPAYDEFIAAGRQSIRDPEVLFFELTTEDFVPFIPSNGVVRRMTENDVDAVARLLRLLHQAPMEAPLTEEEKIRVRASPNTGCLEVDGNIVAVASTNGLAFQAFQILGVATDPAYRRRGCAKAVCSYLICSMREQGGKQAIIFTEKENSAAINCYLSLGFRITDRYYAPWFNESELVC